MPQLDILQYSVVLLGLGYCIAFGLTFDFIPFENFLSENKKNFYYSPLDQFIDILSNIGGIHGSTINAIFLIAIHLIGNYDNPTIQENESFIEIERGVLGKIDAYDSIFNIIFNIIIIYNFIGLIPYQSTITSYISVAFIFSLGVFFSIFIINHIINKLKWFGQLLPSNTPFSIIPFLLLIELISFLARGLSLGIRLFANMLAGHALLKILSSFTWITTTLWILILLFIIPWGAIFSISGLETAIAYLQSYVFVMLSTIYVGDAVNNQH